MASIPSGISEKVFTLIFPHILSSLSSLYSFSTVPPSTAPTFLSLPHSERLVVLSFIKQTRVEDKTLLSSRDTVSSPSCNVHKMKLQYMLE